MSWNEDRTVRIFTPFAGRVSSILVQPGDNVKQGQTLAVIASPDFGQAQAETRRAQGEFALAKQNLARMRDLHEHGVAAAKDLNAAEADFARAESECKRTEARLKLYGGGSEIDQTYALKSPLAGVVVEKNINPGQELRPDQMTSNAPALFVITNPASSVAAARCRRKGPCQSRRRQLGQECGCRLIPKDEFSGEGRRDLGFSRSRRRARSRCAR